MESYGRLLLVVVALTSGGCYRSHPTDDELRLWFDKNREHCATLASMFTEDLRCSFVTEKYTLRVTTPGERRQPCLDERRWGVYRRLLAQTGLDGMRRKQGSDSIYLNVSVRGALLRGSIRGAMFSRTPPARLCESLRSGDVPPGQECVVPLGDPNWYLFLARQ